MIIAGFESSTPLGGVSVLTKNTDSSLTTGAQPQVFSKSEFKTKSHSEVMNQFLAELLDQAQLNLTDIDLIALGIGPGSFTGLRVSVNIAKTLAYSLNKKIIPVNTLYNLAATNFQSNLEVKVIRPMINAYKNMVYTALYERNQAGDILELQPPAVIRLQNLDEYLVNPVACVGDGVKTYEPYLQKQYPNLILRDFQYIDYPSVETTVKLALQDLENQKTRPMSWKEILPLYLRASEAEENKQGIKFIPL